VRIKTGRYEFHATETECLEIIIGKDGIKVDRIKAATIWDCNNPEIGSYNNYHLSTNGIPQGSQRWYGLVYLVYKNAGSPKGKA